MRVLKNLHYKPIDGHCAELDRQNSQNHLKMSSQELKRWLRNDG